MVRKNEGADASGTNDAREARLGRTAKSALPFGLLPVYDRKIW